MRDEPQQPECRHWIGAERRHCRSGDDIRDYLTGPRCPLHTPSALQGKPEPGPGLPASAWPTRSPLSDSRVHDARAIASGKRRAAPNEYRAAQAAIDHRTELNL